MYLSRLLLNSEGYRCYSPTLRRYSPVQMLPFFSLLHISPLLVLLIIIFPSHLLPSLFLPQVSYSIPNLLILSSYFHNLLLFYVSTPFTHHHLLLCHHQLPPLSLDPLSPWRPGSLPMAIRKGTRSCVTKHPISHFVSSHLYLIPFHIYLPPICYL
jgi:hypothetical protein